MEAGIATSISHGFNVEAGRGCTGTKRALLAGGGLFNEQHRYDPRLTFRGGAWSLRALAYTSNDPQRVGGRAFLRGAPLCAPQIYRPGERGHGPRKTSGL